MRKQPEPHDTRQRQAALANWDNEGGAGPEGRQPDASSGALESEILQLTNAEVVQLRIRVVALENLVITLLAQTSNRQLDRARDMAAYISPRPGFTHHRLTLHAAAQMIHLVDRADHFRAAPLS